MGGVKKFDRNDGYVSHPF